MTTKKKAVRQRIQFAFNADADSAIGGIFHYLIKNPYFSSREGKRKGLDAMIAFYKPFACQSKDGISDSELRSLAQSSVNVLARHIELLCSTFGLERPTAIAPDLKTEIRQAIADALSAESGKLYPSLYPNAGYPYEAHQGERQQHTSDLPPSRSVGEERAAIPDAYQAAALNDITLGDLCTNAEAAA